MSSVNRGSDPVSEAVLSFVSKTLWEPKGGLNLDTKLREDIKISGDDAAEFISDFATEFSVDMTNFRFDRYFEPEGGNPFLLPYYFMRTLLGLGREGSPLVTVTVQDLTRSARAGRWIDPEESTAA